MSSEAAGLGGSVDGTLPPRSPLPQRPQPPTCFAPLALDADSCRWGGRQSIFCPACTRNFQSSCPPGCLHYKSSHLISLCRHRWLAAAGSWAGQSPRLGQNSATAATLTAQNIKRFRRLYNAKQQ